MELVKKNPWAFTTIAIILFATTYVATVQLTGAAEASTIYECPAQCDGTNCPHAK
jgi:hypothetical protein